MLELENANRKVVIPIWEKLLVAFSLSFGPLHNFDILKVNDSVRGKFLCIFDKFTLNEILG